ncbi:hypothetical protein [Sneathiella aquimaris]|uniref:hypothetical protein n=1 Tax=Sneathiella aquimaris TaxID=2599305 RepID=UPI00146DE588|nr:hypothetical protein [Sneathiella aquimaris]
MTAVTGLLDPLFPAPPVHALPFIKMAAPVPIFVGSRTVSMAGGPDRILKHPFLNLLRGLSRRTDQISANSEIKSRNYISCTLKPLMWMIDLPV